MSPQTGPKPMLDVSAPKPQAAPNNDLIQTEIEHSIPVKMPGQPQQPVSTVPNPIAQPKQFMEEGGKDDAALDHILKDVNHSVAKQDKSTNKKSIFSFLKRAESKKTAADQPAVKNPKPMLAALAAILVAGALGVAAFYAFKPKETINSFHTPEAAADKVNVSTAPPSAEQSDNGSTVQPSDITNLSSELQKINSQNDSQDYNQTDLGDQQLGL